VSSPFGPFCIAFACRGCGKRERWKWILGVNNAPDNLDLSASAAMLFNDFGKCLEDDEEHGKTNR
jgi:hypothetical protein